MGGIEPQPGGRHPLHVGGGHGTCPDRLLACGLCLHLDRRAVHAGGPEQGGEHLAGPCGTVEGDPCVLAASAAVVAGDAPDLFRLGAELVLGQASIGKDQHVQDRGSLAGTGRSGVSGAGFVWRRGCFVARAPVAGWRGRRQARLVSGSAGAGRAGDLGDGRVAGPDVMHGGCAGRGTAARWCGWCRRAGAAAGSGDARSRCPSNK